MQSMDFLFEPSQNNNHRTSVIKSKPNGNQEVFKLLKRYFLTRNTVSKVAANIL